MNPANPNPKKKDQSSKNYDRSEAKEDKNNGIRDTSKHESDSELEPDSDDSKDSRSKNFTKLFFTGGSFVVNPWEAQQPRVEEGTLHVSNLGGEITPTDLWTHFTQYATIKKVYIRRLPPGRDDKEWAPYGFVTFENRDLMEGIMHCHHEVKSRVLKCSRARARYTGYTPDSVARNNDQAGPSPANNVDLVARAARPGIVEVPIPPADSMFLNLVRNRRTTTREHVLPF